MKSPGEVWNDSIGGFIIVDSRCRQILYSNQEAVRILVYPEPLPKITVLADSLGENLRKLLPKDHRSKAISGEIDFFSGRRHYICQFALLETGARGVSAPAVAVILERSQTVSPFLSLLAEQFQLTCRESESMELLCKGLSTKEIAAEMKISPNTAKAFLRLVMLKMGVQGRSGILGAILQRQLTQLGAPLVMANSPERIRRVS